MNGLSTHELSLLFSKSQLLEARLLEYKSENKYPYWLFDSRPCTSDCVELVEAEMALCAAVGPERTRASRAAGFTNMLKDHPGNEEFNEINGIAGELAYAKRYNLYPAEQFEIRPRQSALDSGDFVHYGASVDVKTTKYPTGRLTLSSWKHAGKVDVFCLVTGNYLKGNSYQIRGFMLTQDLAQPERYRLLFDHAPGKQFIAGQHELYSLEEAIDGFEALSSKARAAR